MLLAAGTLTGGEVEWERWLGHGLSAGVWVRYTDSREHASGQDLPYQPRWLSRLRVDYMDRNGNRLGVSWLRVGERWADLPNTQRLDAYDLLSVRAARQLNLHTDIFLSVDNVLDARDGFWLGYPLPGTRVRGGFTYRF